jgi:hypothetical protein
MIAGTAIDGRISATGDPTVAAEGDKLFELSGSTVGDEAFSAPPEKTVVGTAFAGTSNGIRNAIFPPADIDPV